MPPLRKLNKHYSAARLLLGLAILILAPHTIQNISTPAGAATSAPTRSISPGCCRCSSIKDFVDRSVNNRTSPRSQPIYSFACKGFPFSIFSTSSYPVGNV
jgi:hypothetical protein